MAVRQIYLSPDPALTSVSAPVTDVSAPEVRDLIHDLKETVVAAAGVGLAAPQVGEHLRIIVINHAGGGVNHGREPYGLINPEVLWASSSVSVLEEGCLSLPGVVVPVSRPSSVRVRAFHEHGGMVEIYGKDLLAKILQHEIDHLNGKLITDYLPMVRRGSP
jgi:peptide deformylase